MVRMRKGQVTKELLRQFCALRYLPRRRGILAELLLEQDLLEILEGLP